MSFDSGGIGDRARKDRQKHEKYFGSGVTDVIDPIGEDVTEQFFPKAPAPAPLPSPVPTPQEADIDVARKNARERMLRARGRGASQSAGLLRQKPSINRPVLSDTLG
jgi:hypothetical protein